MCYPARGQEFAAASIAALREQRDHHAAATHLGVHDQTAKGAPSHESWAAKMGKVTGTEMVGPRLVLTHRPKVISPSAVIDAKGLLLLRKSSSYRTSDSLSTIVCERFS